MIDTGYAYACFTCLDGLHRIKIPITPGCKHELTVEHVCPPQLPSYPALLSHNHVVYVVGGTKGASFEFSSGMYIFDPSRFQKLSRESHKLSMDMGSEFCLDYTTREDFESMVEPRVIRVAEDKIFLLSVNNHQHYEHRVKEQLCFQYFNPIRDYFETLPSLPLAHDHVLGFTVTLGHFFLSGHIYLFVSDQRSKYPKSVFSFNTKFSKWEEKMYLLDRFDKKQIPPPFSHHGDIGLSNEFSGKTHILVAFSGTELCAYQVKIHDGDFEPISYRVLKESCYPEGMDNFIRDGYRTYLTRLADLGDGKFCAVTGSYSINLLLYVFQIDFKVEHDIQNSTSGVGASSSLLYYKKLQLGDNIQSFCIASAPPEDSSAPPEDQDMLGSTSKRGRSEDEALYMTKTLRFF